jgi:hypothetical protein
VRASEMLLKGDGLVEKPSPLKETPSFRTIFAGISLELYISSAKGNR